MQRLVIVGGGAGGLALAARLGKRLVGKPGLAEITLIDAARIHVWKPLLHQLAAGSFYTQAEQIEYLAQARCNHFRFRLGWLSGLDRNAKTVQLAASHDQASQEITPAQTLACDTLVISVGSQTNDFGTPGADAHSIKPDTPQVARRFNEQFIDAFSRAQAACQQAMHLARSRPDLMQGGRVARFVFNDRGSLVSLSESSAVGSLMGSLTKGSFFVEGVLARRMYWSLYKQHQLAPGGWRKTALITLSEWIDRPHRPRIKLH
ncbi:MAG: FAD-dependent oxidoreductase [Polaromonas sp.]|nr:FAD-dependent oxidoreductase [Polaromonas sp.]